MSDERLAELGEMVGAIAADISALIDTAPD